MRAADQPFNQLQPQPQSLLRVQLHPLLQPQLLPQVLQLPPPKSRMRIRMIIQELQDPKQFIQSPPFVGYIPIVWRGGKMCSDFLTAV